MNIVRKEVMSAIQSTLEVLMWLTVGLLCVSAPVVGIIVFRSLKGDGTAIFYHTGHMIAGATLIPSLSLAAFVADRFFLTVVFLCVIQLVLLLMYQGFRHMSVDANFDAGLLTLGGPTMLGGCLYLTRSVFLPNTAYQTIGIAAYWVLVMVLTWTCLDIIRLTAKTGGRSAPAIEDV